MNERKIDILVKRISYIAFILMRAKKYLYKILVQLTIATGVIFVFADFADTVVAPRTYVSCKTFDTPKPNFATNARKFEGFRFATEDPFLRKKYGQKYPITFDAGTKYVVYTGSSDKIIAKELAGESTLITFVPHEDTCLQKQMIPWVHYLPLEADSGNLENLVIWCENNPRSCENVREEANTLVYL